MTRVLFVTWDGPGQPYLKSLFLPIFRGLHSRGFSFDVLELSYGEQVELHGEDLEAGGHRIRVRRARVFRRGFPLTLPVELPLDALRLAQVARELAVDVVMPRSHLPAAIALLARPLLGGVRLVWDMDGFMPDERADFGGWSRVGPLYQSLRGVERAMCRQSSRVLVRTEAAKSIVLQRMQGQLSAERVSVVTNGRDATVFQPFDPAARTQARRSIDVSPDAPLVVYAGSLGPQYLPDEMARVVEALAALRPDTRWLLLTGMKREAEALVARFPSLRERTLIRTIAPLDVPRLLAAADVGLSFRSACLSQRGVAPVKVAEYLLCGVPIVATPEAGDLASIFRGEDAVRLWTPGESSATLARWIHEVALPERSAMRAQARAAGVRALSIESSIDAYNDGLAA